MEKIPDGLNAVIAQPEDFLLLIDFDGTLVDITQDPRMASVPESLRRDLIALYRHNPLQFVIVTGRPVCDIDGFMGGVPLPVLGGHGVEFRLDPARPTQFNAIPLPEDVRRLLCEKGQHFGCYVEDKIYSLSLHARDPDAYTQLEKAITVILVTHGLTCRVRRMGRSFEILQQHVNKGSGIAHILALPEFRGKKVIYIGDDTQSDESLSIVTQKGGALVGVGMPQEADSGSAFSRPAALRYFLSTLAAAVAG